MAFHFPTPRLLQVDFVRKEIERVHDFLTGVEGDMQSALAGVTHEAKLVRAVRDELARVLNDPIEGHQQGDYYSHNQIVSLVQSIADEKMSQQRLAGAEHDDEAEGQPYTKLDLVGWGADILLSLVRRAIEHTHAFNPSPAEGTLEDNARFVLLSDWGTGREGAAAVGRMTERFLGSGAEGRPTHVVHLGDTYYSGTPTEQVHNLLAPWPVSPADSEHIASWALNGNHDMYSGGHGLFETTLSDPRFERQRAHGAPSSWFLLRGREWNVLGLDTAWNDRLLELDADGHLVLEGGVGHLTDAQHDVVRRVAQDQKKLLVLSHHQLFVAYGGANPTPLADEMSSLLDGRTVEAWFWGHEHDCLAYEEHAGVRAARSIGNGAVPEVVRSDPAEPVNEDGSLVKPTPPADLAGDHPLRAVRWEYRGYRIGADNEHWMKHGFVVVDVDGDALEVRYLDDEGVDIVELERLT